jgi:sugar phosphate isomerase/epimerase
VAAIVVAVAAGLAVRVYLETPPAVPPVEVRKPRPLDPAENTATYSQVEDGLYVGGRVNEPPPGTQAVLCLSFLDDPYSGQVANWNKQSIHDAAPAPSLDWLEKQVAFVEEQRQAGRQAGMQQGLHNEGFELSMVDGKRTYDLLLDLLDPELVKFQFQMSTISQGFVAHEYFTRYPGRFFSMHLQDIDLHAAPASDRTGPPPAVQVPIGKGSIDWVKTFATAKAGGVKNYFVEQNMELTRASVAALKAMKV